jgi:hypothetical protein
MRARILPEQHARTSTQCAKSLRSAETVSRSGNDLKQTNKMLLHPINFKQVTSYLFPDTPVSNTYDQSHWAKTQ